MSITGVAALVPLATDEPLGERIGGLIFWPILAVLLGILVWAFVRTRRGPSPRRAAKGAKPVDWTRPESYAEHHTVRWAGDPATFVPRPEHWPLAVAEVFGICSGAPWDRLRLPDTQAAREGIDEAWGIRSRPQLLSRLHWLLREGHRVDFEADVQHFAAMSDDEARALRASARTEDEREAAWRLLQVRADSRGIRSTRFEAWDLVRAAMIARAGYSIGWLTEAETIDTLNLLSAELQRTYSSWQQLGEHFTRARWFWGGTSDAASRSSDAHDESRTQALLAAPTGPWSRVPWQQPVPDSRVLLADALVAEDLVDDVPLDAPTRLARIVDEVVAERLRARL